MVEKCDRMADIGTDHAYIPVYLVDKHICREAIASDINCGPIEKAKVNIKLNGFSDRIECRIGSGLDTIKCGEVQQTVIAGMGGNLIRDIIDANIGVFKNSGKFVLQPVQNPEVLRKYIYSKGFKIIDEDLCIDENIFYEIIKVEYDDFVSEPDSIFYEVGKKIIEKKHPLAEAFIQRKIYKYNNILRYINDDGIASRKRKVEVKSKIIKLRELIECLSK
jgi:tRNA (adenine22-N1)-methyltransferase